VKSRRGAGFDLIRIAAALSVFAYHTRGASGIALTSPLANHGNIGVPVFFALSGYLIYRPFLWRPVEPVSYILRRSVRMAPAWLVAVVGVRLAMPWEGGMLALVMWSLVVELTFYGILPLLARAARNREYAVIGALGVASYLAWLISPTADVPVAAMPLVMPLYLWSFAPGMLLAVLERDNPGLIRDRLWLAVGLPMVLAGLVLADGYPAGYSEPGASLLVVLGSVGVMGGLLRWPQNWAWAAVCADATYSFYLWHAPVLNTLAPLLAAPATLGLGFLFTGVISVATTVILERPIRQWIGGRLGDGARPAELLATLAGNPAP
jgi:peptidoglycan/LPS O-acetylase OafA/YrhL